MEHSTHNGARGFTILALMSARDPQLSTLDDARNGSAQEAVLPHARRPESAEVLNDDILTALLYEVGHSLARLSIVALRRIEVVCEFSKLSSRPSDTVDPRCRVAGNTANCSTTSQGFQN